MSESAEHEAHSTNAIPVTATEYEALDTLAWLNQHVIAAFRVSAHDLAQLRNINRAIAQSQQTRLERDQ